MIHCMPELMPQYGKRFVSNTGVLNLPIPYSKLISGETSAITWSGLIWQNLNINVC